MPETIRAKMKVTQVYQQWGTEVAKLDAVYGEGNENASFAAATPAAHLKISITNPAAQGFFKPGREYYLDFTPAPEHS